MSHVLIYLRLGQAIPFALPSIKGMGMNGQDSLMRDDTAPSRHSISISVPVSVCAIVCLSVRGKKGRKRVYGVYLFFRNAFTNIERKGIRSRRFVLPTIFSLSPSPFISASLVCPTVQILRIHCYFMFCFAMDLVRNETLYLRFIGSL